MANRLDRDPPSLNVVEGREAHRANEARIGRFHQGQRAESPHQRPDTKLQSACPSYPNRSCVPGGVHTKNHVNVDRRYKLVRRYQVSDAATHDSKVLDDILDGDNTALGVWADSAYRSAEIEAALKEKG